MKYPKELYNYIQIIIVLFLILGVIMLYNRHIHPFFNLVIILILVIAVFIQNNMILAECVPTAKEGLSNYDCFKLYSMYVTNQYKTDVYDMSLNKLITTIRNDLTHNTEILSNYSTTLTTQLNILLDTISKDIQRVMEKANAWNGQYTTTLKGMNNMMNTLYGIQRNLDPSQYPDSTTNFTIA